MEAFILSGGGAKGAYEAGVLHALAGAGLRPDILAGSSIGAMNAAILAARLSRGESLLEASGHLLRVWRETEGIVKFDRFGLMKGLLLPRIPTRSLFQAGPLRELLRRELGDLRLSDFQEGGPLQGRGPRLLITGTDLQAGRTVLFGPEVSLVDAVLASGAYPVALPTVEIDGRQYTDGGLFSNTPLKFAIRAGATRAFVIQLSPADYFERIKTEARFDSVIEVAPRCIDLLWSRANYLDLEEASRINRLLEALELLDWWRWIHGTSPVIEEVRARLLTLGRIEKEGRQPKQRVEIVRIQPKAEPLAGTFSLSRAATSRLIRLGIRDAREVLSARAGQASNTNP
ncbi:MAG: patatin-like phospholipase family protein [Chloroflexi bacterium]|nr:patatin-like phospholipase family protein [Chloroflexota bacterium]